MVRSQRTHQTRIPSRRDFDPSHVFLVGFSCFYWRMLLAVPHKFVLSLACGSALVR